jgi:single-strand DNA-binding protein
MTIDCAFVGRPTHDPELKQSAAGKSWCRISLAIGHGDGAQFVSCAIFGEPAEHLCATFHKNDKIYIEGAISLSEWTGKDGKSRTGLSVVVSKAEAPGIGRNRQKRSRQQAPAANDAEPAQRPSMLSA